MLTEGSSSEEAIRDLVANPAFHRETIAACEKIQEHTKPCGGPAVLMAVGKLFAVFSQPERSEAEWSAFWETYTDALSDIPLEALRAGVKDAVRAANAEFLPKPGPLRDLCLNHAGPIWDAAYRARRAADLSPIKPIEIESRPSLEEIKAALPSFKGFDPA